MDSVDTPLWDNEWDPLPLAGGGVLTIPHIQVMGILNATPDSFSDGGEIDDPRVLEQRVESMLDVGVDIIDIGGESTRPGHDPVSADEELHRVLPVIGLVRHHDPGIPISVDTRKATVAEAALNAGASLVNDVSGLSDPDMAGVVRSLRCAYIAMRANDCVSPIVASCRRQLAFLVDRATKAGIPRSSIIVDPGLGFGTRPGASVEDNLALVDAATEYSLGRPVLIGASRKRFVGAISGEPDPKRRLTGSVAMAVRIAHAGAAIVRVHDVKETVEALIRVGMRPAPPVVRI